MDIERLDFNLLATLDALLAERNVTHAANRLNISQPALSARLARLRALFDDPLMLPAPRGMIPTQRALELQAPLHEALEGVRQVVAARAAFNPLTARATVGIIASDYVQHAILTPLSTQLRTEAPEVRIAWRTVEPSQLMRQLSIGDADLAIVIPQIAPDTLRMRKLYVEDYVLIARHGHPAIDGAIDIDGYCALDHIVVSPAGGGFTGPADTALAAIGRSRRVVLSAPGFLVVPRMVETSDMIALVPKRIVQGEQDRLQILPPPLAVPCFAMAMIWHDRATSHPLQRWLRDRIFALAADSQTFSA